MAGLRCLYSRFSLLFLFALISRNATAQFYDMPGDYSFSLLTERVLAAKDSAIHSGLKPYIHFFSPKYIHVGDSHKVYKYITEDPAIDLIFYKHFLRVEPKKEKLKLRLDPLLNLEYGREIAEHPAAKLYSNTRGVIGSGYIGDKFYFETLVAESQAVLPVYISNFSKSSLVIPGQGRWKGFKGNGFDYAFSSGFFSVQVLKNLNIQAGHGKQKIGNGYRSLLLSDNAFNYPYARITQQWFKGRIQYSNIYAVFMNLVSASKVINPNTERLFQKKAASFQYLSINLSKRLNLSFFQGLIWQAGDGRNKQHLDWQYFNPVIYSNLASYGLNNRNNIVTGLDLKLKITNSLNLYGQLMLDRMKKDSLSAGWGCQTGVNYFNAFGLKNFFLQAEYNYVSAGSYLNPAGSPADQSYSHYSQNLAYTPGCGNEFIAVADYKFRRFFMNLRYHYQEVPLSSAGLGYHSYVNYVNARLGYLINPAYNLNICLGMALRTQNFSIFNTLNNQSNYIYLGFKTSIYNLYYDF